MEWRYHCNKAGMEGSFYKTRWKDFVVVVVGYDDDDDAVVTTLIVMTVLMEGTCHLSNCRHDQMPCRIIFGRGKGENKIKVTSAFLVGRMIFCMCIQTI